MPCNRELTLHMKQYLENQDISRYKTNQNVNSLNVKVGGAQNLGVNDRDCRNFIDKRRPRHGEER